jgi:hypothetical protein
MLLVFGFTQLRVSAGDFVLEPQKQIPVIRDVDVAVAGAGVTGVFAAIAAARSGAKTILIERFATAGGTSGPGLNPGGGTQAPGPWKESPIFSNSRMSYPIVWVYPEIAGIPKEFTTRLMSMELTASPIEFSQGYSYLSLKMLQEAGVELLLSTFVTDPIMEGNRLRGVFVENKSGRGAIRAKVVIDATGEADVARRARAPILYPKESYNQPDKHAPTGMGVYAFIAGVDWQKYKQAVENKDPRADLSRVLQAGEIPGVGRLRPPGTLTTKYMVYLPGLVQLDERNGIAAWRISAARPSKADASDAVQMSRIEVGVREYIWETVQRIKKQVPGCEHAYLIEIAPYLGLRGGPCIEGEYTLTEEDTLKARRFDDVMYLYGTGRALTKTCIQEGKCQWTDIPYRVMVPKRIDGLLAFGRSASGIPDTLLRIRTAFMHMGQAGGNAATLAARQGISPRQLEVKELQRKLVEAGFYLGDKARLRELGLAD